MAMPLSSYEPDSATVDSGVLAGATNVYPTKTGYGPVASPLDISPVLGEDMDPLTGVASRGAISVLSTTYGFSTTFAGTVDQMYRLTAGGTWSNETGAMVASITPGNYWSFSVYGDRLIATPQSGATIEGSIATPGAFTLLPGSPPTARFNTVIGEFLVLGALGSFPNAVQWSHLGNIDLWTPGAPGQLGDIQIFPDGGAVTGMVGGEFGIVFQQRCIRRMIFSPGSAAVFDFSVAEENRGCVSPSALVAVGGQAFFLDRDGFYVLRGSAAQPIGIGRVNRTFFDRADASALESTLAIRDPTGPRVIFAYRSKTAEPGNPTLLDEAFVYDWLLDRWSFMTVPMECALSAYTPFTSLDTMGGDVDVDYPETFDSAEYLGGAPGLGIFTSEHKMALLIGPSLEASFESSDVQIHRPSRAFVNGLRLDTDASGWRCTVGSRETLSQAEPVRWRGETGPNDQRYAPCRASGRYHRAIVTIPAEDDWTYATTLEVDSVPDGLR